MITKNGQYQAVEEFATVLGVRNITVEKAHLRFMACIALLAAETSFETPWVKALVLR